MYNVIEFQNGVGNVVLNTEDKETAFEKFFDVARYIPKSQLDTHSVIIINERGNNIYPPITKDIIKAD